MWLKIIAVIGALAPVSAANAARTQALTPQQVNAATFSDKSASKSAKKSTKGSDAAVLKAQVLLDRAGFSPGAIDAAGGDNFAKALAAYQKQNALQPTGKLDQPTWTKLTENASDPALVEYQITEADVKGPFVKRIPQKLEDKADLDRLAYTGPRELLAEKFHVSDRLLKALNPRAAFERAGATIVVPNVGRNGNGAKAAKVVVDKNERSVRAIDESGKLLAFYPATIGSDEKPAPSGSFKVNSIAHNPTYRYNPKYAFKEVKVDRPFTIKPGPNNPVGTVWIDLTAPSYGIHGTPEPEKISKTESHGCVRLTNWDVEALAKMVSKGTPVEFVD